MSKARFLTDCFAPIDHDKEQNIISVEKKDYCYEIVLDNCQTAEKTRSLLRKYFGDIQFEMEMIPNTLNQLLRISRVNVPNSPYSAMDILKVMESNKSKGWLLGIGSFGPKYFDTNDLIHAKLSGASGYGKSSFFRFLMAQTLAFQDDIVNYIIDPKAVDFKAFKEHPRVATVAETKDQWRTVFSLLLTELDQRKQIFSNSFTVPPVHLKEYREMREKYNRTDLPEIPRIILWVDEIHILDNYFDSDVIEFISRTGRAFGIHIIASSQNDSDFPSAFKNQAQIEFAFYQNERVWKLSHIPYEQTPIQGRVSVSIPNQEWNDVQAPYISSTDSLSLAFGFNPSSKYPKSGLLSLNATPDVIRLPYIGKIVMAGDALNNDTITEGQVNHDGNFKYTTDLEIPSLQLSAKLSELLQSKQECKGEPQSESSSPSETQSEQKKYPNEKIENLVRFLNGQRPKTSASDDSQASNTEKQAPVKSNENLEGLTDDELEIYKTHKRRLENQITVKNVLYIRNRILTRTQNSPDLASHLESFRKQYANSQSTFEWCLTDHTSNVSLNLIKSSINSLNDTKQSSDVLKYDDLILEPSLKESLDAYVQEVEDQISRQAVAPLLVISGPDGVGKETILRTLAHRFGATIRLARFNDFCLPSEKAELQSNVKSNSANITGKKEMLIVTQKSHVEMISQHSTSSVIPVYLHSRNVDKGRLGLSYNEFESSMLTCHYHLIKISDSSYNKREISERLIRHILHKSQFDLHSETQSMTRLFANSGVNFIPSEIKTIADRAAHSARMKSSAPSLEILSQTLKNYRLEQGNKQKQARVVQPVKCLNDLVTDPAVHDLVADAVHMAKNLSKVRFKFAERLRPNSRVACLFSGAPGTGKSMAAEVIAKETNRELWVLDYSSFMSPYVGETEHNLTKIFEEAALADAVILFDEAETFLKNRIQLSNSYEIKIVNHIINLMESFKGIIVMTTNHPEVIDPAFERRFDIKVAFPLPSKPQMISLLKKMLEPDAPLEVGFDYDQVVDGIELSGGNIRNAIERAVMKMERKENAVLTMTDVREALLEIQSQLHVITDSKPIIGIKNT